MIIAGFLIINLALFIWRIITPFARMYYKDVNGRKRYFGYIRRDPSGEFEIIDPGRIIGDKKIGVVEVVSGQGKVKMYRHNNSGGANFFDELGYVDKNGDIYDINGNIIAKCDPIGKRSWRDLWLIHRTDVNYVHNGATLNTGFCTQSLRFGTPKVGEITMLAKAAAALVLCEDYLVDNDEKRADAGAGARDLALPAALLYLIGFSLFSPMMMSYKLFPGLGEILSYLGGMLVLYFILWWTLYLIKTDFANRNVSFSMILNLINRNTGIRSWNFWLVILSIIGLISSTLIQGYLFVPLFIVALIGVIVNWTSFSGAPWEVRQPGNSLWRPEKKKSNKEKVKTLSPTLILTTKTVVKRVFSWDLKSFNIVNDPLKDKVEVEFYKEDFESVTPAHGQSPSPSGSSVANVSPGLEVRNKNPFYGKDASGKENWENAVADLRTSIHLVLNGSDGLTETTERNALDKIINSAYNLCQNYGLADFELYELLLHFCQTEINYKLDENSNSINNAKEYVRFAAESLYDKEGDCDCKASLAYKLFERLGLDVKFAIVSNKDSSEKHAGVLVKKDSGKITLPPVFKAKIPGYPDYAYCEATGLGWEFGEIPESVDINSIEVV